MTAASAIDRTQSASVVGTAGVLPRRAIALTAANVVDYGAQILLLMVLARCLEATAFGQFRLLWLVAGTVMAVAPLALPASLYYFWPRVDAAGRLRYLRQTLVLLVAAGLASAAVVGPWNGWLPDPVQQIAPEALFVPAFVVLWVLASLLDVLPTVDERVAWQARATLGLALLRTGAIGAAALLTRQLWPVLLALLGFVVVKVVLLLAYVVRHHGLRATPLRWPEVRGQLRYAAPFAAAGALYNLRVQADQWVVASLFSLAEFASFSVAALFGPLLNVLRQSVNNTYLPSMSRCQARGDAAGLLALNGRANVMVAAVACPLFVFIFAFAEEVVTLVYTAAYLDAAPVMQIYVLGFMALVVELATVTLVLAQGPFVMRLNLLTLALNVLLSVWAALHFGASAAAWGTVVLIWFDRLVTLRRVARLTGLPLARLQDWPALARELLFALAIGAGAWLVVAQGLAASNPLSRLALGGTLLVSACVARQMRGRFGARRQAAVAPGRSGAARCAGGKSD